MRTSSGTAGPGRRQRWLHAPVHRYLAAALLGLVLLLWATASAADTQARVDALMQSVPFRSEAAWYDGVLAAMRRLNENDEVFVPMPALLGALADRDVAMRRGAAWTLAEMSRRWGWEDQVAGLKSPLIAALQDDDARVRENVVRALGRIRPFESVGPALTVALDDPNPWVRWAAVGAVTRWDRSDAVAAPLTRALDDPDPRVRLAAAFSIQGIEAAARRAMPVLVDRFRTGDPATRVATAEQLLFFWRTAFEPEADRGAIRLFAAMLDDPEVRVRRIGAVALSRILFIQGGRRGGASGPEIEALIPSLATALADHDPAVRAGAAWALRSLGETAAPALAALDSALDREADPDTRWAMRMAREVIANRHDREEMRTAAVDRNEWFDRSLCLPKDDAGMAGLRAGDPEQKVRDVLGEPDRLTAGESEDDGGGYIVYTYHYPELEVDIARDAVERLSTTSPTVPTGRGLRAGMTRQEVLTLFGARPTAEATAARRFNGFICDDVWNDSIFMRLTFDESDVLDRIEWVVEGP